MLGGGSANGVAGFGCHGYGWEAEQGGKGCRAPPSSAGARDRQGAGAGHTAGPGAGPFSWDTHGRSCLNAFRGTPGPKAQLQLRLLQELHVHWGTPLTAHQDTWEGQPDPETPDPKAQKHLRSSVFLGEPP